MFLFRIGKEKWSYTLTMSLHKLKYSHVKELEGEHQFKFTMKRYIWRDTDRGNHKLNFVATINKKGRIHCDHKPQDIPMTLYYDKDTDKFNEKLMTIQGKIYNDIMEEVTDLGDVQLDIAQYAKEDSTEKFALEVELEGGKDKVCIIKFDVTITRNFDENAEFTNTITQQKTQRPDNKPRKNSRDTQLSSPSQKQIKSQGLRYSNFLSLNPKSNNYFGSMDRTKDRFKKIEEKEEAINLENETTQRQKSIDLQQFQSEDNDTVIMKRPMYAPVNPKDQKQQSLGLKLFEAERLLKQKQKELIIAKRELKDQRTVNEVLAEQKKRESNQKQDRKMIRKLEAMQTQLEVANMKISQLQSENRSYMEKLETAEDDMIKLKQHVGYYRSLLEKEKLKVADIIQKAFQTGDIELITFMEDLITEE